MPIQSTLLLFLFLVINVHSFNVYDSYRLVVIVFVAMEPVLIYNYNDMLSAALLLFFS
jgi:hypothetical protein